MAKKDSSGGQEEGLLVRWGMGLADWSEKWFPDAFVFALAAIVIVFLVGLLMGSTPMQMVNAFGNGFWVLIPFTMQMAMIIIGGYAVASSPPIYKVVQWLGSIPRTQRGAIAFVVFFSTFTSLISWGFSLIFSGLLVREIVRRLKGVDYRAIGAAAYLGLGSIWALGLSSSAALLMATKGSIPPNLLKISGVIPLTRTIFTWQSLVTAAILLLVSVLIAYFSAPSPARAKTAESYGISPEPLTVSLERREKPGEWLEYSPLLTILVALIGLVYLGVLVSQKGLLQVLDLNTYNLLFLMLGLLLHWRPRSFVRAVSASVPATAGVLLQFPFYAGIFGIITGTAISAKLAGFFVAISTQGTYPLVVSIYSAILGLFVPSGGSKWIIEAPYVLQAANTLHVNTGWVVQIYNAAEALPNLLNPFWMLPLLGLLKIRAREMVGYSVLQLLVHLPVVLFLMWLFARTLPYVPPAY